MENKEISKNKEITTGIARAITNSQLEKKLEEPEVEQTIEPTAIPIIPRAINK